MKKVLSLALALFLTLTAFPAYSSPYRQSSDDVYVKGYTRSDGTQVRSHYRSAPDGDTSNNYGSYNY